MADKAFTRGQTQILYRFLPGAIFDHDDYGLCVVDEISITDPGPINHRALFQTLGETLRQWEREDFRAGFPDPRDEQRRRLYKIGQPAEVRFSPFPRVLQCRTCKHVVKYDTLKKRKNLTAGLCPRPGCGGRLSQLRYVDVHNCGRMQEIYVPEEGCPYHGTEHIRFFNPGRVQNARWVCGMCRWERKLRMTPCNCVYTAALKDLGRTEYDRFLKVYPTGEPGLYIPQVVAFINFDETKERLLTEIEDGHALMLARLWGFLSEPVIKVATEREKWAPGNAALNPALAKVLESLRRLNPEDPALKRYEATCANPPGQEAIEGVKARLRANGVLAMPPSRRLVEHIALLDSTELTDETTVVDRLRQRGALEQANDFEQACHEAMDRLGFCNVRVINDFPIAMAAIGYTRVSRDPNLSVLNPFPPDEDGKIPLFVIPTETEGLWFQLNPVRVAHWLVENGLTNGPVPEEAADTWAWLYERVLADGFQYGAAPTAATRAVLTLLHTVSHVLLQRIEWSGFGSSSVGEYLIPETLSFILYGNRFAEAKIGGLTTLFEQRLPLWLKDAAQAGRSCIYDPLCSEDGGSCAGCLHREHNCPLFNHRLSRAVLYGGVLPPEEVIGQGRIEQGYWMVT
ncbi:MAG: hypothetical protein ACOYU7_03175 [Bacillota bacterium]